MLRMFRMSSGYNVEEISGYVFERRSMGESAQNLSVLGFSQVKLWSVK